MSPRSTPASTSSPARYPPCPDAWPSEVVLIVRVATFDVAELEQLVTALRASLEADGYEVR